MLEKDMNILDSEVNESFKGDKMLLLFFAHPFIAMYKDPFTVNYYKNVNK